MRYEKDQLLQSKNLLQTLANGLNPLTKEPLPSDSFLRESTLTSSLFYLSAYIDQALSKPSKRKRTRHLPLHLTKAELQTVCLPEGKIGIQAFTKAVNQVLDRENSQLLTAVRINKQLKRMGILSEIEDEEGGKHTVTNDHSEGYGIESVQRKFRDREYEQVLFNETGKQFLLEHLVEIMAFEEGNAADEKDKKNAFPADFEKEGV
ncbi:hypothetical protein JOC78_002779 [Bacillus ectoiniformans]|uniref:hypothetical protein n=1 Tax=Bacillus ectoiniformans TaxID=1494429 RepID=UPI00195B24E5|nr:hypothetical protein [Bacillus ectoiniformans]MBM7649795.1 hypothetical protein [Bacillus ectoiniformans]